MLEFGASLVRMQDEVMMASEQPWDPQEASSPVKMLIWLHGLDDGAESHTFWALVKLERPRLKG